MGDVVEERKVFDMRRGFSYANSPLAVMLDGRLS